MRKRLIPVLTSAVVTLAIACSPRTPADADSARMVDAALRIYRDSMTSRDSLTGVKFRMRRYVPDSLGACVWIENTLTPGPFPIPMRRDGTVRADALRQEDCLRS